LKEALYCHCVPVLACLSLPSSPGTCVNPLANYTAFGRLVEYPKIPQFSGCG